MVNIIHQMSPVRIEVESQTTVGHGSKRTVYQEWRNLRADSSGIMVINYNPNRTQRNVIVFGSDQNGQSALIFNDPPQIRGLNRNVSPSDVAPEIWKKIRQTQQPSQIIAAGEIGMVEVTTSYKHPRVYRIIPYREELRVDAKKLRQNRP